MARKEPKLLDVDPDTGRIIDDDSPDNENLQADQDKSIDEIINEFEASDDNVTFRASINKIPDGYKRGGREEFCFNLDSAEIRGIREKLRDEYGAGIYRVRIFKNAKQVRQFDYHIAKPTTVKATSSDNIAIHAILEELRLQREETRKLTERLLSGNQQITPVDPFQQMERMTTIIKNLRPEATETPQGFSMKDGVELFTKGMEIAADMKSEGGGDTWISVIKEMVKGLPVGEMLANIAKVQNQPQRRLPAPGNNQNQIPPNQQRGNISPAANGQQLEGNMRYLIAKAINNANPELYAEWLLDNADQNLIRQMANDPNVLAQLAVVFPRLNEPGIHAWFVELVENVKAFLAEMDQSDNSGVGIGNPTMQPSDAGSAVPNPNDTGWNSGDKINPENNAPIGETGAQEFPNP